MAKQDKPRGWQRFRVIFRRCRITVWLVILAVVSALLYLNCVGLPGFIQRPILEKLHARGLDLQFSRLRWHPSQGIVAENVFFGRTNDIESPQLTLKEMQVRMDYRALLRRQFQVDSLQLRQGRLVWPIVSSNEPPRQLAIENIQTDLQLATNDVWVLENLQAQVAGARIQLTGAVTNASAVRDWKYFHGPKPGPGTFRNRIRRLADTLDQVHFATPPELKLDVQGDARNLENTSVRLFIRSSGVETPWGTANGVKWYVLLAPPKSNQWARAEVSFRAADATTRWAAITNVDLSLHLYSTEQETNLVQADLNLTADSAQSRSNHAERVHFAAQWVHSLTNAIPLSGEGELEAANAVTDWAEVKQFRLTGALLPSTNAPAADASWAWWTSLAPYPILWECNASGIHSPKLDVDEIICSGNWRGPDLTIDKLGAKLYDGKLDAGATLNVATRVAAFRVKSDFDPQKVSQLLTPMAQNWLANYSWQNAPQVSATGSMTLPSEVWTNRHPDWRGELRPTLRLDGEFHVVDGAFRGVHVLTADSHFIYSNMCWRLPDLVALRPEGRVNVFHTSDERTKEFYFWFHSAIDPRALRPMLTEQQQRAFDFFSAPLPPVVDGEVWGRWRDHDSVGARAHVAATNFTVRGQAADYAVTDLQYTNRILTLLKPQLHYGTQELNAASVKFLFDERKIAVANGFSTADPTAVARAIGPHVQHAVEPYHFLFPPTVHVEGVIPMHDEHDADLHFDVDGNDFMWWKFDVPHITGKIDWVGEHLTLKEVRSDFYLGKGTGEAEFIFDRTNHNANYRFTFVTSDANLHLLAKDLSGGKTNKLEGLLTGRLEITSANSSDLHSLQGAGRMELRDGLIWDIPIFGVFSPVLDTVMPGLGSSRARQGSATFIITNGVIDSEDLKIETLMARLRYRGTIDLSGTVNARMEAELLRNAWVVGPVLSLALWPVSKTFEYEITGSIHQPKSEPVYIPKIFFFPLHPVQTIKELMPESNSTNAPPSKP